MSRKRVKHWGEPETVPDHELKVVKMSTSKIAQLQEVMEKEAGNESQQDSNRLYKK